MSEVQLPGRSFVGGLVAQQFRDAQNGGQRIVQFMRHAGDHLAHGREALGLNELLLEPLLFGNVARRSDHAVDAPRFVMQRPRGGAEHTPCAVLVLRAVLDLALGKPLENQIVEHLEHRGPVRGIRAASHPLPDQFLRTETENFENLWADKRVPAIGIEGDDQVGEAVHQAAREFLFAVEAALHFALLGNIHEGSLVAHKLAGGIADRRRRVDRNHVTSLLPVPQSDFMRAQESQIVQAGSVLPRGLRACGIGMRFRG